MRRLAAALLFCLACLPVAAGAQPAIRVGAITAERDCRLYEGFWGNWVLVECRNNFAALRDRLQSALAETGRFGTGGGGYSVTGTITELGLTNSHASGRDYAVGISNATASLDVRLRDAGGRVVYAGTIRSSVEAGSHVAAADTIGSSASSSRAVYDELQRALAVAAARSLAFRVDPLRVTAVSGRQVRLNYGAPFLANDDVIQVTDTAGFPQRYRVSDAAGDGAVADAAGQGGTISPGAAAMLLEGEGPNNGGNRFARAELPGMEDIATAGDFQQPPPPLVPSRPATIAGARDMDAPGQARARPQRARLTASRGEAPSTAIPTSGPGPRIALVVGVSLYGTLGNLANPANDARALAAALQTIGFDVELVIDPDQRVLKDAISRLGERMARGGNGSTGLFYFAGHGIQARGVNFLIPARAAIRREADLDLEAVAADTVLSQMQEASGTINIIILDACRNMPLTRSFRTGGQGLAQMNAPNGSFIAYSTAPGAVAADGEGMNSPFATALLREIGRPGQPIETIFRNVRRAVLAETGGQQTPWDSSSLVEPFFFRAQ